MKKRSALLLLVLLLALTGCGKETQWWEELERDEEALREAVGLRYQVEVNQREDITMTLDSITPSGAQMTLSNRSEYAMDYGEEYAVLRQVSGYWVQVPPAVENVGFNAIGYTLPPGEEITLSVDWSGWLGELPAGTYRFFKSVYIMDGPGTLHHDLVLAVDFELE